MTLRCDIVSDDDTLTEINKRHNRLEVVQSHKGTKTKELKEQLSK